jgi:hypothetical protein
MVASTLATSWPLNPLDLAFASRANAGLLAWGSKLYALSQVGGWGHTCGTSAEVPAMTMTRNCPHVFVLLCLLLLKADPFLTFCMQHALPHEITKQVGAQ